MKKFILTFLVSLILALGVSVSAFENAEISGYTEAGISGEKVTITVFSGSELPENINPLEASYYNQIKTDENGYYSFDLSFLDNSEYVAYIKAENEEFPRIEYLKSNPYIINEDFEEYAGGKPVGEFSIGGDASRFTKNFDDDENSYLGIDPTGATTRLYKVFPEEIADGRLKIAFKFMVDDLSVSSTYLRFMSTGWTGFNSVNAPYMQETLTINNGKLGYYEHSKGFKTIKELGTYEQKTWVDAEIWLDVDNRMIYYFIDNQYIAKEIFNCDTNIKGLSFTWDNTTGSKFYFDDFVVKRLEYNDILEQYNTYDSIPEEFADKISFNVTSKNVGNIFFEGEEIKLNIEAVNHSLQEIDLELEIEVTDNYGKQVTTFSKSLTLGGETSETFEYIPNVSKFGTYNVYIGDITTGSGKETDFSYSVESSKKSEKYGTNVHMSYNRGNTDKLMPLIQKSGYGMTRDVWNWQEMADGEHNPNYDEDMLRYFDQSLEMDIDIFAILGLTNSKYQDSDGGLATDEASLLALENYAEKFAAYYKDSISYIELGNELNHEGKGNTPEEYYLLMKAAYAGIKKGNKDTKVVAFATSSIDLEFIEAVLKMCQADGFYPFDAVSVHTYHTTAILEEKHATRKVTWVEYAQGIVDLMAKYGLEDKEIWSTEMGWYTDPTTYSAWVDRNDQAALLLRTFALNDAYGFFDRIILYDFQDDGVDNTARDHHWGTIECFGGEDTPYSAKPAFPMIANYNNLLADAECVDIEIKENKWLTWKLNESYSVKYKRNSDNADVYMLWNTKEDSTYTLSLAGKSVVRVYDGFGNSELKTVTDGTLNVEIGTTPVYVEVLDTYLKVSKNGKEVTGEIAVTVGDVIKAELLNFDNTANIFIAGYENGRFSDVVMTNTSKGTNLKYTVGDGIDSVKVMVWDENYTPLVK